jgi:hypothetical protein
MSSRGLQNHNPPGFRAQICIYGVSEHKSGRAEYCMASDVVLLEAESTDHDVSAQMQI